MEFSINHPALFILSGIVVAVVLAQSIYFLAKALRRSKELGMDQAKIKKTIRTAEIFTIAPAVAIVISVIALSKSLGLALPWLRLSVVGSMSYETVAASNALQAMGQALGVADLNAQQFVNVLVVMTVSIMAGLLTVGSATLYITLTDSFAAAASKSPEMGVCTMAISLVIVPVVSLLTKNKKAEKERVEELFTCYQES